MLSCPERMGISLGCLPESASTSALLKLGPGWDLACGPVETKPSSFNDPGKDKDRSTGLRF